MISQQSRAKAEHTNNQLGHDVAGSTYIRHGTGGVEEEGRRRP